MKLKILGFAIAISAILTSAYAQGLPHDRVIVDFTRTDRLTGTPAPPAGVIPNQSNSASWSATLCVGCVANYTPTTSAGQIFGTAVTYGGSNCEGSIWAINRTSSGSDVGSWVQVAASNTGGGNDGGSGMWNTSSFVFPMLTGASYIAFKGGGCHGGTVNVYATSS